MRRGTSIVDVTGSALYDSNGHSTIEVCVRLGDGTEGRGLAPRGSSKGQFEAIHLEDEDAQPGLEAVAPALAALSDVVAPAIVGRDAAQQFDIDYALVQLSRNSAEAPVGGNTTVATSLAVLEAASRSLQLSPRDHLCSLLDAEHGAPASPMINIIDGSPARGSTVYHHEFLLFRPAHAEISTADFLAGAIRARREIEAQAHSRGEPIGASKQGALSMPLRSVPEGLDLIVSSAESIGLVAGVDFRLGLDMAAADVHDGGKYRFAWSDSPLRADELAEHYRRWIAEYPLGYVEDPFSDDDVSSFQALTADSADCLVAGDDLYASNPDRIRRGCAGAWSDAVVLKPNQVGTITQVVDAAKLAHDADLTVLVSQRSGENGSGIIAHLASAVGAAWVKCGGTSHMDRVGKINALLTLERAGR